MFIIYYNVNNTFYFENLFKNFLQSFKNIKNILNIIIIIIIIY